MPAPEGVRLPAEWERQRATLLAWPSPGGDWSSSLAAVRGEYAELISKLLARQDVILLLQPSDTLDELPFADHPSLHTASIPHDDTWCRDYGPICLLKDSGRSSALDFTFNAWGGKYDAGQDNRVNQRLLEIALLKDFERVAIDLELEGGAIDSDGAGRLLVNWSCLTHRLPERSRADIERALRRCLHLEQLLAIDVPALPGDDTDGHIDTIARFATAGTIVYQQHSNRSWTARLEDQLKALRDARGQAYELVPLPEVAGFDPTLPANYVNFLFVNGACLVPAYGVASDAVARQRLAELLPGLEVLSTPARTMITQFGGPHCATMHIPEPDPCQSA
jgi:agmatine/peptidylarginine deiminase